ncbi:hypothetical protein AMS68_001677 [Peltaster fructicola]|uniref:Signal recognition particle SRP19 subunit n=1 Tax=Peltaster fructicola TaxID=286661 RepID=A0A6H0XNU8_9PEZI|nr:hypothetical protein AMS68_001677 [Peltaster fructicola]
MANPRIEEVDDASDPDEMDLEAFDFAKPQGTLQSTVEDPSETHIQPDELQRILAAQQQPGGGLSNEARQKLHREQVEKTKSYQCIYPIYFDASRSREQGRRVSKEDAVQNPLAREIVEALQHIGTTRQIPLQVAFEPTKTHPKDWANPGRIRVLVKKDGKPANNKLANKAYLYKLIAEYLKSHPATQDTPLKMRFQGLPPPKDGKAPEPAIPRGFKMGTILPLHSPALTGGGVNDMSLQDMMQQMGGQLPAGMMPPAGGSNQKKIKVVRR